MYLQAGVLQHPGMRDVLLPTANESTMQFAHCRIRPDWPCRILAVSAAMICKKKRGCPTGTRSSRRDGVDHALVRGADYRRGPHFPDMSRLPSRHMS